MKFDVAVMNPPYDRNLHLKVLEQVIPTAETVINISPVRWLQDPFAKYMKSSDYNRFEDSISKKIESIDVIDAKTASTIFDASFIMNLGIYVCGKGGYNYDMETSLIKKIIEKTMKNSWAPFSWKNYFMNEPTMKHKPYILNISSIAGELGSAILNNTYEKQLTVKGTKARTDGRGGMGTRGGHFEFDTEDERHNFYDCYNHRFMKWTYSLWKVDVNLFSNKVPYFGDYTKPWTTKMFCDYFEITGYIDDEHAVPGSEWETIMNQW